MPDMKYPIRFIGGPNNGIIAEVLLPHNGWIVFEDMTRAKLFLSADGEHVYIHESLLI